VRVLPEQILQILYLDETLVYLCTLLVTLVVQQCGLVIIKYSYSQRIMIYRLCNC